MSYKKIRDFPMIVQTFDKLDCEKYDSNFCPLQD